MTEFPYWMYQRNSFWGEGIIGAEYRIIMPKNEITIIYDLFRSNPFDRFMAKVNVTDENIETEVIKAGKPVIVDF